jgi:hypothetical protein
LKVSPSLEDLESRKKKKFDSKEVEEELLLLTFSLLYDSVEEGTVEEIPVERSRKKRESGGIPLYSFSLDLISSSREKLEDEISRHRRKGFRFRDSTEQIFFSLFFVFEVTGSYSSRIRAD